MAGVRYISDELIHKVSKQNHLEMITSLNLTLNKEGNKKIKVGTQAFSFNSRLFISFNF